MTLQASDIFDFDFIENYFVKMLIRQDLHDKVAMSRFKSKSHEFKKSSWENLYPDPEERQLAKDAYTNFGGRVHGPNNSMPDKIKGYPYTLESTFLIKNNFKPGHKAYKEQYFDSLDAITAEFQKENFVLESNYEWVIKNPNYEYEINIFVDADFEVTETPQIISFGHSLP